jgi:hypothetical protein
LTFPKGAQIKDPHKRFNTRIDSKTVHALDFREGDATNEAALQALMLEAVGRNQSQANEPSLNEGHHLR